MLEIKDSVAVVTGGASGIGLEVAKYWGRNGGKVVLGDVAEDALARAEEEIKGDIACVVCDVTKEADCARLADTAIEKFGQINLIAPFAGIIMDGLMIATDRETGKVKKKMPLDQFQKVVEKILSDVPIGRLVEPEEVASLVVELYRNEALAGDVFYIHGGLRLGSRG
jgi:3-oxoacyl-[acyl-carrier protein] reductase